MPEKDRCQVMFRNMLEMSYGSKGFSQDPTLFTMHLHKVAARCSDINPKLEGVRAKYEKEMGNDVYQRVISIGNPNDADFVAANHVVAWYRTMTREVIYDGLTWSNTVWFHTDLAIERTLSWITGASLAAAPVAATSIFALGQFRKMRMARQAAAAAATADKKT